MACIWAVDCNMNVSNCTTHKFPTTGAICEVKLIINCSARHFLSIIFFCFAKDLP